MRPSPQSSQLRPGLQWEALKYQGGCYGRAAGVWALPKATSGTSGSLVCLVNHAVLAVSDKEPKLRADARWL